jgi:TM2 domain-containing membrane protein YozV
MLTTADKILIEQRVTNEKPSVAVAYVLLIFLGIFGAHRFYLGKIGSGIVMLLLSLTVVGLIVTFIWSFIDLFLIPGQVREQVNALRQKLTVEAMAHSG